MKHMISNDNISIMVKNHGAELCSFRTKKNEKEYMWQADAQYWSKHSPVLFPIIGCLKDNQFEFDGKNYRLGRHGFARDMVFDLVEEDLNLLRFKLSSNEQTLACYPFEFEVFITYQLVDQGVTITYEVVNQGNETLFFSIGAHPAFNCDMAQGHHFLEFEKKETLKAQLLDMKSGLRTGALKPILEAESILPLNYALFVQDALVFENVKSDFVIIRDSEQPGGLKVSFKDFPYLGIWTPNAPFVCIEPWYGVADAITSEGKLKSKEGMIPLEPSKTFTCSFQIEIIE